VLQLVGSPVVGVLMRDHDGDDVVGIGKGNGEGSRVDHERLASGFDDEAGVFELGDFHVSSLLSGQREDTPRGYSGQMIEDIKKRALHRSRILQGQLRGLEKMIENEEYCVDIITQNLAIQKSLSSLNKLLVENHLRTHVTDMFEEGGERREAAVSELLTVFELTNNRGSK
jgi:DNA-binding FrmR family transcriptional regulator